MRRLWLLAGLLGLAGATSLADDKAASTGGTGDVSAQEWINTDGRTNIADFKGEVVMVEEFATW